MSKATETVEKAKTRVPDMPHRVAIKKVLKAAALEAYEAEQEYAEMGRPHLRTFLQFTPLGIAILELAQEILEQHEECPYDFAHTRHWCGNDTCRDS